MRAAGSRIVVVLALLACALCLSFRTASAQTLDAQSLYLWGNDTDIDIDAMCVPAPSALLVAPCLDHDTNETIAFCDERAASMMVAPHALAAIHTRLEAVADCGVAMFLDGPNIDRRSADPSVDPASPLVTEPADVPQHPTRIRHSAVIEVAACVDLLGPRAGEVGTIDRPPKLSCTRG